MVDLRKYQVLKIVVIGLLLLGSGYIAAMTLGVNPLARAKPEDRSLSQLFDDMDVELLPDNLPQVSFQLKDISGADVDIADYRGKFVFLNFWATWCAACVVEMPAMEKLHQEMPAESFAMVAVSIQEPAIDVKRYVLLNRLTFDVLLDSSGKTVPGFGIREIPTTLLLDTTGRLIGRVRGPREWDSRESIAMFNRLTGGQFSN
jgi:thiol-disulfide isomerase/thioredoxin